MAHEFLVSGDDILVNVSYAEAYIPSDLFKEVDKDSKINSAVAYMNGEAVTTVGVFNMRFYQDEDAPKDSVPLRTFNYPSPITTYPDEIHENVSLDLTKDGDPQKYMVLCYRRGNIMMAKNYPKDSQNCEKFLNMMMKGKIPKTIPYDHILTLWEKNFRINNVSPGVPSAIMQAIIATQARCKDDPVVPFRKEIGKKPTTSPTAYTFANMRAVASYTSVFNALSFEDTGYMLTTSINMTRSGVDQARSPVERALHT